MVGGCRRCCCGSRAACFCWRRLRPFCPRMSALFGSGISPHADRLPTCRRSECIDRRFRSCPGRALVWHGVLALALFYQLYRIYPYTPVHAVEALAAETGNGGCDTASVRVLVANVRQSNRQSNRQSAPLMRRDCEHRSRSSAAAGDECLVGALARAATRALPERGRSAAGQWIRDIPVIPPAPDRTAGSFSAGGLRALDRDS